VRFGRAYVTGTTTSANYPTTPGAFDRTFNGSSDVFVTKLNASGSTLTYSTFLGGMNVDRGTGIAVDRRGRAYVVGQTSSADFPTTPGAFDTTLDGSNDAFVTKLPTG
jgi:Beta-propeller repeat